ncbi:MAG: hypothetical protein IMW97_04680 [Firmicutes bacterium]|nr:hypothetical protein [Candidatus Fermentithermobacillaceae bacterium]
MRCVSFKGTLATLMSTLRRILPHAPVEGGGRWRNPRILWGRPDASVRRVILEDGIDLTHERKLSLLGELQPGDCLVMLELSGMLAEDGLAAPAGFDVEDRWVEGPSPSVEWTLELLRDVSRLGGLVVSAGNTWEAWEGGPSGVLAQVIRESLPVSKAYPIGGFLREKAYKVVVFVPRGHEDAVRDAMAREGAGHIGNYSHCTFQAPGQGTFMPLEGSHPYIGSQGKLERADEFRLETLVRERSLSNVVEAMLEAHPYEEVAYDVFELKNASLVLGATLALEFGRPVTRAEILAAIGKLEGNAEEATAPFEACGHRGFDEPVSRIAVSRFCGKAEVDAACRLGAGALVYVEETYPGRVWSNRLNLPIIRAGRTVYDEVLKRLGDGLKAG